MNDFEAFKNKNTILNCQTPKEVYYFYIIMVVISIFLIVLILW